MDILKLIRLKRIAAITAALALTACASTQHDRGSAAIASTIGKQYQIAALSDAAPSWEAPSTEAALTQSLAKPLSAEQAVQIALRNNPKMRMLYADLGIAQAELLDATRISNPSFNWTRLKPTEGNLPAKLSFGLSQSVTDLLMLGARRKLGSGILQRTSSDITAHISSLIFETESAYWHAVGAEQVRAMRALVAESAKASSDLAERFFAAGNINRAQRAQENAAAAEALVALKNAEASALGALANLNQMLGLEALDARVKLAANLPAVAKTEDSLSTLQMLAQTQRADLAAKRQNVTLLTAMLGSAKRWRWFGSLDISAERERETDGETNCIDCFAEAKQLRGIGFSLGLPIFNQGQGSVLHASAMLETASAQRDQMQLKVRSEVALGLQKLNKQSEIVATYSAVLVPAREAAVAEMQKRYNFMLIGAFELLQAKQAEYDAYQGYLDALRDYWIARSELKLAVGGELPSSAALDQDAKVGLPTPPKSTMGGMPMEHGAMQNNPVYVCPMHSDISSDKPGDCPICGMTLEPKAGTAEPNQHQHNDGDSP